MTTVTCWHRNSLLDFRSKQKIQLCLMPFISILREKKGKKKEEERKNKFLWSSIGWVSWKNFFLNAEVSPKIVLKPEWQFWQSWLQLKCFGLLRAYSAQSSFVCTALAFTWGHWEKAGEQTNKLRTPSQILDKISLNATVAPVSRRGWYCAKYVYITWLRASEIFQIPSWELQSLNAHSSKTLYILKYLKVVSL